MCIGIKYGGGEYYKGETGHLEYMKYRENRGIKIKGEKRERRETLGITDLGKLS